MRNDLVVFNIKSQKARLDWSLNWKITTLVMMLAARFLFLTEARNSAVRHLTGRHAAARVLRWE